MNELDELDKLEKKRALYIQGNYMLSDDSLNNEVINPEFQAIDKGLYERTTKQRERENPAENKLIQQLQSGNKISLGSW